MTYKRKPRNSSDEMKQKKHSKTKELLISPPVLKAPTPDSLLGLESDTSHKGVDSTLLEKQENEWVVIGYHSK